jgi:acyl-coenzyme A thioesterase PaaI-like protein
VAAGARSVDGGHGRIEVRTLHARPGQEIGWLEWPGLRQVCRVVHQTRRRGRWQIEIHYKITSLPRAAGLRHFAWHLDQAAQTLGLTGPPLLAASRVA